MGSTGENNNERELILPTTLCLASHTLFAFWTLYNKFCCRASDRRSWRITHHTPISIHFLLNWCHPQDPVKGKGSHVFNSGFPGSKFLLRSLQPNTSLWVKTCESYQNLFKRSVLFSGLAWNKEEWVVIWIIIPGSCIFGVGLVFHENERELVQIEMSMKDGKLRKWIYFLILHG